METTLTKFELPPINYAATFIVAAWPDGHTVGGHQPKRGEIFDKSRCGEKLLRTLYEKRWIAMVIGRLSIGDIDGSFTPIDQISSMADMAPAPGWTPPIANNPPKRKAARK